MDIVEMLGRALDQTGHIVGNVRDDQWDLPTPCEAWNVRTVVGHLVRGNENTAAVAQGKPRNPDPISDVGDDPAGAYQSSADAVKQAWRDPELLNKRYPTPLGEMPASAVLTLRLADNLTHGWDVATATGQIPDYDDDLVATAMQFAQRQLARRVEGGPFAPPVEAGENSLPIERLVAFLGRQP